MRNFNIIILFLLIFVSCQREQKSLEIKEESSELIEKEVLKCQIFNDSAIFLSMEIDYNKIDTIRYNNVIDLFNIAILCDSTYYMPWYNKVIVLFNSKNYNKTLESLLLMDSIFNDSSNPKIKMMLAENYFYLNDKSMFYKYKAITISRYENNFKETPTQENFISYATSICRFEKNGYNLVVKKLLPTNKKLFSKKNEYDTYLKYFKTIQAIEN